MLGNVQIFSLEMHPGPTILGPPPVGRHRTQLYKKIKQVKNCNFQERLVPQAVLAMIARFFATYAMNTNFQFTVEVERSSQDDRMHLRESLIPGSSYCTERAGDGSCQCDVNVQPDGIPRLRLLGWSFFLLEQLSFFYPTPECSFREGGFYPDSSGLFTCLNTRQEISIQL